MRLNGVTLDRLRDRRTLLASYDSFRLRAERSAVSRGLDAFNNAAFEVLTSSKMAEALDLEREDPRIAIATECATQACQNLLADDGVIFISIDDNEADNLQKNVWKFSARRTLLGA